MTHEINKLESENNDLEQEREDEDEPLQVDEPNPPVTENYDLNGIFVRIMW